MVTRDQITVEGKNYLAHRVDAESANNSTSKHAFQMVAAIKRSNLNQYRAILKTDLHDADTKAQMVAWDITITEWKQKSGDAYERYDAYTQEIQRYIELLDLVEIYLDGRHPEKSSQEYIKVAHDGYAFWCQRFLSSDGVPSATDENTGGCAKFDAPSLPHLVAVLRSKGKLQPVYEVQGDGFRKVG